MRWSKVKKLVEDWFAHSIKGRVQIYSTAYRCTCGRGWFTIDGKNVADLSAFARGNRYRWYYYMETDMNCIKPPASPMMNAYQEILLNMVNFQDLIYMMHAGIFAQQCA